MELREGRLTDTRLAVAVAVPAPLRTSQGRHPSLTQLCLIGRGWAKLCAPRAHEG